MSPPAFPLIWYAAPIVVTVSLAYGATRHEETPQILHHAFRCGVWILSFMGIFWLALSFLSWIF